MLLLVFTVLMELLDKKTVQTRLNQDVMTKIEQLNYIDKYIGNDLSKDELRILVYDLINDESLRRSFRMFSQV